MRERARRECTSGELRTRDSHANASTVLNVRPFKLVVCTTQNTVIVRRQQYKKEDLESDRPAPDGPRSLRSGNSVGGAGALLFFLPPPPRLSYTPVHFPHSLLHLYPRACALAFTQPKKQPRWRSPHSPSSPRPRRSSSLLPRPSPQPPRTCVVLAERSPRPGHRTARASESTTLTPRVLQVGSPCLIQYTADTTGVSLPFPPPRPRRSRPSFGIGEALGRGSRTRYAR